MICPALGVSPTDRPSQNKFSTLVANKWSTTVSLDELKKEKKKYIFGLHFHYEVKSRVIYTTTTNHYCVGSFKQHQREWGDLKWSASSICRMFLTLWLHKRFWVKIVFWILWMLSSTWHPPFPWPPAHTMDLSSTGTNLRSLCCRHCVQPLVAWLVGGCQRHFHLPQFYPILQHRSKSLRAQQNNNKKRIQSSTVILIRGKEYQDHKTTTIKNLDS